MMKSFYQGVGAMKAMQEGLAVVGNNIANAKTTGYKARDAKFADLIYQQMNAATAPDGRFAGKNPVQIGGGVKLYAIGIDQSQGNIRSSSKKTDLAINGNGFFVVGSANAQEMYYTRDGSLQITNDGRLATAGGQYVYGWNVSADGRMYTDAQVQPIEINLGQTSLPSQTTRGTLAGNLNANALVGDVVGIQMPVFDTLGAKHDININFVKTDKNPNQYTYIATPSGDFQASESVQEVIFRPSEGLAQKMLKGEYEISTSPSLTPGMVEITVTDPSGAVILTQTVDDKDQTVTLSDGVDDWFTIEYVAGGAPSNAIFQVAEVGTVSFDSYGSISSMTGSGVNGSPQLSFVSENTGDLINVDLNISGLTGLATDSDLAVTEYDGFTAASLRDFDIGDNGMVYGFFNDGTIQVIAQLALATFENPDGLRAEGNNLFVASANSGDANIGVPGIGDKGQIIGYSLEESNVDIASSLTEMMFFQRVYQADARLVTVTNTLLDQAINLIR